jgi:hypothetical protein
LLIGVKSNLFFDVDRSFPTTPNLTSTPCLVSDFVGQGETF